MNRTNLLFGFLLLLGAAAVAVLRTDDVEEATVAPMDDRDRTSPHRDVSGFVISHSFLGRLGWMASFTFLGTI